MQRPDESLSITWIGHSTVLLEHEGVRVLTDPLLRGRVGHVRRVAPVSPLGGIRNVDAVLISHVHYDHLDLPSLRLVDAQSLVVPRGAGRLLAGRGSGAPIELSEGDEVSIGRLTIRATHAEHRARRHPLARVTPSLGYLLAGRERVYFAGDTDVFHGMSSLDPALDVALLPISGWGPRLPRGHLDPEGAARALGLLRPRVAIPIHWGTYRRFGMSGDPGLLRETATSFERLTGELAPETTVCVLSPGERVEIPPQAPVAGRDQGA